METYQDEFRADGVVAGERECATRYDLLASAIPPRGMILDIGSNLGYFGLRAVTDHPEVAVVSIEADRIIAERQRDVVATHGTDRMVVLQGEVSAASTAAWADTCDAFDLTLALAVLHWVDDPAAVVRHLSSMSASLVCEVPDPADAGACGQDVLAQWTDPVAWFRSVTGRDVELLGRMARHTSDVPSHVIRVHGPVTRHPRRAYWDAPSRDDGHFELTVDADRIRFSKKGHTMPYRPGVNLVNLMRVGALVHPEVGHWWAAAAAALDAAPRHPDPFPHNMVWGPDGITMIDFDEVDALLTRADAERTLAVHLPRWASGATVGDGVVVREAGWFQRARVHPWGRAVLSRLPVSWKRRVRELARHGVR